MELILHYMKSPDLSLRVFGDYTVTVKSKLDKDKRKWECVCKCGSVRWVTSYALLCGASTGCGCTREISRLAKVTKHGHYSGRKTHPTRRVWGSIKDRCYNSNSRFYVNYGARGILMSDEWKSSFDAFLHDMGHPPAGLTIERMDVNKGYCKENCCWATRKEQARNRRNTRRTPSGQSIVDFAEENGLSKSHMRSLFIRKVPFDEAVRLCKKAKG